MRETQQSISTWAAETFGPAGSDLRVAGRANEEMAELVRAATADAPIDQIIEECADVLIVLARLGDRLSQPLDLEIPAVGDFGPDINVAGAVVTVNVDLANLLDDLAMGAPSETTRDLVLDVWDGIKGVIVMAGGNAAEAVTARMAINRRRVWKKTGDGHGYHRRDKVTEMVAAAAAGVPKELTAVLETIGAETGRQPQQVLADALAQMKAARHG
jgi:hypothetical protein